VSLLLDALKRAEQEKHVRHAHHAEPPGASRAAPPQLAPAAPATLELQAMPGPQASNAPRHDSAAAARAVFHAKTAHADPPRHRGAIWAGIGAVASVVIAAGAYVWYSVETLSVAPVAPMRPRPPAAPTPTPGGSMGPASSNSGGFVPQPPPAAGSTFTPAADIGKPLTATLAAAAPAPAVPAAPASARAPAPALAMLKDATPVAPAPALQLERSSESPQVPAAVASGYAALRNGDLPLARRSYAAAVAAQPANVDAQLGLATVEARLGNRGAAANHYRKTLEVDPRNATALAGMAALADGARPEAVESQLRSDLGRHPTSAALHFALGNLYASQARWNEAQAAFFEAHRLDPGSADVLYNLAVSLDQLGQRRLAADYYRRVLDAARGQATQFDPAPVARRLAELGP
jgi:Tfp pilus assembly protein PilF